MTTDITAALAYLKGLHERATSKKWELEQLYDDAPDWYVRGPSGSHVDWHYGKPDATLIAVTRNVLPELLAAAKFLADTVRRNDHDRGCPATFTDDVPCDCYCGGANRVLTALAAAVARERGGE